MFKLLVLAVIVIVAASCKSVSLVDQACQNEYTTLFTANEKAVQAYGANKIAYQYAGPFYDEDPNGVVVTVFYAGWLDCEEIPGTKREA